MGKTNSRGYQYLVEKFPKISAAKLKEGIFVVQIREVLKDGSFDESLIEYELRAGHSFKWIYGHFLGKNKSPTYRDGIQNLLDTYHKMGCRMSLKIHFLHSHLDFFPKKLGAVSDEQGERFHQDIQAMENRYQSFWNESMMAEYCCMLYNDNSEQIYKRKSYSKCL